MLHLILGPSGSGKSALLFRRLRERAEQGQRSVLVVPEQFTSSTEGTLYRTMGDSLSGFVESYSFTSLAETLLQTYGGAAVPTLSDAGRVVLCRRAMDSLMDRVVYFSRQRGRTAFCEKMAQTIEELKSAGISPQGLAAYAQAPDADTAKLGELALIYGAYESLLAQTAMDPGDRVQRAAEVLQPRFFAGRAVYIDEFDTFNAPKRAMLAAILPAADVTVTLCCDGPQDLSGGMGVFSGAKHVAAVLRNMAAQAQVPCHTETLAQDLRHSEQPVLAELGLMLADPGYLPQCAVNAESAAPPVVYYAADSRRDEAKAVAAAVRRLARQGVPYRRMAVICRNAETYLPAVRYEFRLADIPLFCDEPTTPENTTPARAVLAALELLRGGVSSATMLQLVKTGLVELPEQQQCALENYAETWPLHAADWRAPFTRNPDGYTDRFTDESRAELENAEAARQFLLERVQRFVRRARGAGVTRLTKEIYFFLQSLGAEKTLERLAAELRTAGDYPAAEEALREWNTVMELLDQMVRLLGASEAEEPGTPKDGAPDTARPSIQTAAEPVPPAEEEPGPEKETEPPQEPKTGTTSAFDPAQYAELFSLLLRSTDLGHIPQSLDSVIFTTAGRMRLPETDACFVMGLAEGEFPQTPGEQGLLTHADRDVLIAQQAELPDCFENRLIREQVCFYKALTAARKTLWLSWPGGAAGLPVSAALAPVLRELDVPPARLAPADFGPTPLAALDYLGSEWQADTPQRAAVYAAVQQAAQNEPGGAAFAGLAAVERAARGLPGQLEDFSALEQVLGKRLRISPTSFEQYALCPFGYFMKFVLRARPRQKAELAPNISGTLTHWVLENALSRTGENFTVLDEAGVAALVESLMAEYIAANLPGESVRMEYLLGRIRRNLVGLLSFLQQDMRQSGFRPVAFELRISDRPDADAPDAPRVEPMEQTDGAGHTVRVVGTVDRVDVMHAGETTWLRVVDYKTGSKKFDLREVYYGLDCQMLLYLFTLVENGGAMFPGAAAAGVEYLLADPAPELAPRNAAGQAGSAEQNAEQDYPLEGLVRDDPAVYGGMDRESTGRFAPLTFRGGKVLRQGQSRLADAEKLARIKGRIGELLREMTQNLYGGRIAAEPFVPGGRSPCLFCDYRAVCQHVDGCGERTLPLGGDPFTPPQTEKEAKTENKKTPDGKTRGEGEHDD